MEITQSQAREVCALLARLYGAQEPAPRDARYLAEHSHPATIRHHVNVFAWYVQALGDAPGAVLDWGCCHGPDSCLLRAAFAERIDLHACDFPPESAFAAFRDFARSRYRQLTGPTELPYPNDAFDAVIGSGVLEHTAMDQEALKGVYRILKPGGKLVISYLPYRWSWAERRQRTRGAGHRRLYGRDEAATLLKRHGFYPLDLRFQTFVPDLVGGRPALLLRLGLEAVRYPWFTHAALCCIAEKVIAM